jgi:drug/metabolite transporter (DMT)-like permease
MHGHSGTGLRRQRLLGIALMSAAVGQFAFLDTTAKYLNTELDSFQIAWARYTFAILLTSLISNPFTAPGLLSTKRPLLQIARSLLLVCATVGNFLALRWMQLDEVLSIIFTFPFLVSIISGPMLGEWIGARRWAAVGVGFCGVLLITRPGLGGAQPAALFSVGATVSYALYAVITRIVSRTDSNQTSLFYSNLVGALVLLPIVPFVWRDPPSWQSWALLVIVGVLGSSGHFCMIAAHRLAPASVLSPFIYTQLVWVVLLGYLVFDHLPTAWTVAGATIVVGSGLHLLHRERKVGRFPASEGALEGPHD